MKKYIFIILLIISIPAISQVPWFTGNSKAENLRIKLVTFGPGDDIPSWWGHGGIIVEDIEHKISRIYNFGLYSFDNTMLLRFVMGRLIFSVGDFSAPGYLKYYEKMNRDVRIQTLNLSPKSRLDMAEALAINTLPENKDYLYDHYRDNCSTRLRDVIDDAVDIYYNGEPANIRKFQIGDKVVIEFFGVQDGQSEIYPDVFRVSN